MSQLNTFQRYLLAAALAGISLFTVISFVHATRDDAKTANLADVDESLTRLETLYPTKGPIPVIYAYGEPYERGVQIGTQLQAFDPDILPRMAEKRWEWVVSGIEEKISRQEMLAHISEYLDKVKAHMGADIVAEYLEEMRGVGDGAGVSFEDMFMINLGGHYRKYMIDQSGHDLPYYNAGDGCSSIAVWGKATIDGKMLATHNCDWRRHFPNNAMAAVVMYPARGNPLAYAAPIGTWGSHHIASDRLFVAGLALGEPKAKPRYFVPGGPNGMLQRWIVQYADSAEEALEMMNSKGGAGDRGFATPSGNIVYVDENEAMYLQTAPDKIARVPNEDGYNVISNHIVVDEIRPYLFPKKPEHEAGSINRRQAEKYLIEKHFGNLDVPRVIEIMSSHYDYANGRENIFAATPCQHGEFKGRASGTNLSTVVKLAEDTVWLALGNPCISTYTRIRIGSREEIQEAADAAMARIRQATDGG